VATKGPFFRADATRRACHDLILFVYLLAATRLHSGKSVSAVQDKSCLSFSSKKKLFRRLQQHHRRRQWQITTTTGVDNDDIKLVFSPPPE
jgi:hypothetical protein